MSMMKTVVNTIKVIDDTTFTSFMLLPPNERRVAFTVYATNGCDVTINLSRPLLNDDDGIRLNSVASVPAQQVKFLGSEIGPAVQGPVYAIHNDGAAPIIVLEFLAAP